MNDPFNPNRFLYEDSPDPGTTTGRTRPQTSRQDTDAEAHSYSNGDPHHHDGHSSVDIRGTSTAEATVASGLGETTSLGDDHTKPRFCLEPLTRSNSLCIVLVAIFAYVLGGIVQRPSDLLLLPPGNAPPHVKAYIDQAVLRLSRDPVGLRDFALYANGGRVIRELTGVPRDDVLLLPMDSSANASLMDDMHIGNCWRFPDEVAQLGFRTSEMMYPTHVTIDHIPSEIAADIGQAPRSGALWAAIDGSRNTETLDAILARSSSRIPGHLERTQPRFNENLPFILLATFTYDIYSPNNVQTFSVDPLVVDARIFFGVFVLDILNNWGGEATCLYRVRIHGESALL